MSLRTRQRTGWSMAFVVVIVVSLVPVFWLLMLSLKTPESATDGSFIPHHWTLHNYRDIFNQSVFTSALRNSIGIGLISTALAASIGTEPDAVRVAGPAAMDLTRLALSPYEIWRDIFSTNGANIDAALGLFIAKLEALRSELRSPRIEKEFENAAAVARTLRQPAPGK